MSESVVIIVPSQGKSVRAFEDVAKKLNKTVYGSRATIVKTTVTLSESSADVAFTKINGNRFLWDTEHDLSSVLTISHSFICDGPNLAYGAGNERYQTWGSESGNCGVLSADGRAFWEMVSRRMSLDGKIILVGCLMGYEDGGANYANAVSTATGKRVYASTNLFAAGNADVVIRHIRSIEKGKAISPMKRF